MVPSFPSQEVGGVGVPSKPPKEFSVLWNEVSDEGVRQEPGQRKEIPPPPVRTEPEQDNEKKYYPLIDTFRLYAGWLLAWYFLIFALGSYQALRKLPFVIPYVTDLYTSPLIANVSWATFLFLLFTTIQRRFKGGFGLGLLLTLFAFALIIVFYQNV